MKSGLGKVAHVIPPGLSNYRVRRGNKGPEEYTTALCGTEVVRYRDDGLYFIPKMVRHREPRGFGDHLCPKCRQRMDDLYPNEDEALTS